MTISHKVAINPYHSWHYRHERILRNKIKRSITIFIRKQLRRSSENDDQKTQLRWTKVHKSTYDEESCVSKLRLDWQTTAPEKAMASH